MASTLNKTYLLVALFGMTSGLCLMITGNTLNFWASSSGMPKTTIGMFALIALPYAANFLWTPLIDKFCINKNFYKIHPRIKILIIIQILLGISILCLCFYINIFNIYAVAISAFIVAFFSACQDSILGAIRSELFQNIDNTKASSIYSFGYRCGMMISGAAAIYLSLYYSWSLIYFSFAILIFIVVIITFLNHNHIKLSSNNITVYFSPNLGKWNSIVLVLLFLVVYRLPDNFFVTMINKYLLEVGFSSSQIAGYGKLWGLIGAAIGSLISTRILRNDNVLDSMILWGGIHSLSNIPYIFLDNFSQKELLLFIIVGFHSITGGISMSAYICYITQLCSGKYKTTQYSIYSSVMGISRTLLGSFSGFLAVFFGWKLYFIFITAAFLPTIFFIPYLKINKI